MRDKNLKAHSRLQFGKNLCKIVNCKRSQHEIAGFVIIVLVVSIIGIFFLSLMFGQGDAKKISSVDISNLLSATMYYTTDCSIRYAPEYENMRELIEECYEDSSEKCKDGREVCEILEPSLKDIFDRSLIVGEEFPNKAYKFKVYYPGTEDEASEVIVDISSGRFNNCTSIVGGSEYIKISSPESIHVELGVCKSE